MSNQRKKSKKVVTMWLEKDLLQKIEEEAAKRDEPKSFVIENALREELGLPKLDAPSPATPVKYVIKRKKTLQDVRKNASPKKS